MSNSSTAAAAASAAISASHAAISIANLTSSIGSITTASANGCFTVSSGNLTINSGATSKNAQLTVQGKNPKIVTDRGEIDLDHLVDFVKKAEEILCMVRADQERLERYPALQEAYDHYRIIDALCRGDEDGD